MPLKSKKTSAKNNGQNKRGSNLKFLFKRYNPDKITVNGIKNFFGFIFYKVGYKIEIYARHIWKYVCRVFEKIYRFIANILKTVGLFIDKLFDTILDDLGEPLEKAAAAFSNIGTIFKEAKADKQRSTTKELGQYIRQGFSKHRDMARTLQSYFMPLLAFAVFGIVVSYSLSKEFAVKVILDGEEIGTVSNYTVLENADRIISNKLVSTNDQKWNPETSIEMVKLKPDEVIDERQLANNILEASDENIVEATGLYVDGKFIGAVKDPTLLNEGLASLKAPYENGSENRVVSFVEDVVVMDGIFFADTIVPDKELADLVTSEVSGEKRYTVVDGDSPWLIAVKNGITYNTLLALNPDNDFSGLWVGDQVVVGASVPFVQVKYVETVTEQVEIPFKTVTEKNNKMSLGSTKVSQKGEKGINEQTIENTYIDGILESSVITQTTVIKEPVKEIIQSGTLYHGQEITGGTGRIIWPVGGGGGRLSRGFRGQYPAHNGLDIAAPVGTPIMAADTGVVTRAWYTNVGYGRYIIIEHGGYQTLYGHCSQLYVTEGQQVQQGQVIAAVGSTGNSTGPHVHFEVKKGNYRYDPYGWF